MQQITYFAISTQNFQIGNKIFCKGKTRANSQLLGHRIEMPRMAGMLCTFLVTLGRTQMHQQGIFVDAKQINVCIHHTLCTRHHIPKTNDIQCTQGCCSDLKSVQDGHMPPMALDLCPLYFASHARLFLVLLFFYNPLDRVQASSTNHEMYQKWPCQSHTR